MVHGHRNKVEGKEKLGVDSVLPMTGNLDIERIADIKLL
jgi:hypothetical protein